MVSWLEASLKLKLNCFWTSRQNCRVRKHVDVKGAIGAGLPTRKEEGQTGPVCGYGGGGAAKDGWIYTCVAYSGIKYNLHE